MVCSVGNADAEPPGIKSSGEGFMSVEHENFIKTPKQLIIIVTLAFVVPIAFIALLAQLMTTDKRIRPDEDKSALAARIKPIGELAIAGPKVLLTGDKVFEAQCTTCHTPGLAGAPKMGDKAAWAKIVSGGQAEAVKLAISGIKGMPPRGGNPDLTDEEVAGAVVHMANAVGANWTAPQLRMPPAAPAQAAVAAPATPAAAAMAPVAIPPPLPAAAAAGAAQASAAGADKGKAIYDTTCMVCHAAGIAGAPKFGDKAAWAPRIQTGVDALYNSSLKGKNAMPPKGGNAGLPDADVKAAVDFMVAHAK
jgi:cytochrome c5